jgi:hypothetical protein
LVLSLLNVDVFGELSHPCPPIGGAFGNGQQLFGKCRPKSRDCRQQVVAYAISKMGSLGVRGILDVGNLIELGVAPDILTAKVKERTNNFGIREQSGEPARTGVPQNANEDGLDLIVERMSSCDWSTKIGGGSSEEGPPCHAPLMLGVHRCVRSPGSEIEAQLPGTPANELNCPPRGNARTMIEARDKQGGTLALWERCRGMQKNHRVGAARHCQQHTAEPREFCSHRLHDFISFMPARCHGILI